MQTLLHPFTEKELDILTAATPHAIHVTGPKGIGLRQVAKEFADRINADYRYIEPLEKTVSVDQVRDLYQLTRGRKSRPQAVVVSGELLSTQAQHALLKLLEEPPTGTIFIITSHDPSALLGTVLSRMQTLTLRPLSDKQSNQLVDAHSSDVSAQKRAQLMFLAGGLPAELTRILDSAVYFDEKVAHMKQAQQFILSNRYGRLSLLRDYIGNRSGLQTYIQTVIKLLHHDIYQKKVVSEKHIDLLERLERAATMLALNGNTKLIAAQLVL